MQASVIHAFGPAEGTFHSVELPTPDVSPDQVLVRVQATSVNPADTGIRSGALAAFAAPFPAVLHGDVAGTVEAVGADVTAFQPGDEVFGFVGGVAGFSGALAELVAVDHRLLARKPRTASFTTTGALPLVSITAYLGIIGHGRVQPGQTVLVYGGAGGVGHLAVQLARIAGGRVFATVADEAQAAAVRALGIEDVIFYQTETVEAYSARLTGGRGFDVVFDTVGYQNLPIALQAVAANGTVVTTGIMGPLDVTPALYKSLTLKVLNTFLPLLLNSGRETYGKLLTEVAGWVDAGKVRVLLDEPVFSFEEVSAAHTRAESGRTIGKVAISRAD